MGCMEVFEGFPMQVSILFDLSAFIYIYNNQKLID